MNQYTQRTVAGKVEVIGIANPTADVTVNNVTADRHGEYFHRAVSVNNTAAAQYETLTVTSAYESNGSVMALVNASNGTLTARYAYGPFGEPLRASGPQVANPLRFSTKYCDADSGLYYYGYRHYHFPTERWLSTDLLGEPGSDASRCKTPEMFAHRSNLYLFLASDTPTRIGLPGLTRSLAPDEQKNLDPLANAIRQCAQKVRDNDVLTAISAMPLKGIFAKNDVQKDGSPEKNSETTFRFHSLENNTCHAADSFCENTARNDKLSAEVVIHEGCYASKKAVQEEKANKFGSETCDSL